MPLPFVAGFVVGVGIYRYFKEANHAGSFCSSRH